MKRPRKSTEAGQATIEFALTLVFLMALILFYIQISLTFAWGSYIHYATFMSARAFLAAGPDQEDQQARAKQVIGEMLKKGAGREGQDRFPMIAKGLEGDAPTGLTVGGAPSFSPTDRDLSWLQGVRYKFRGKLFMIPFAGSAKSGKDVNSVTLISESWLGREPSTQECVRDMNQVGIVDNGC